MVLQTGAGVTNPFFPRPDHLMVCLHCHQRCDSSVCRHTPAGFDLASSNSNKIMAAQADNLSTCAGSQVSCHPCWVDHGGSKNVSWKHCLDSVLESRHQCYSAAAQPLYSISGTKAGYFNQTRLNRVLVLEFSEQILSEINTSEACGCQQDLFCKCGEERLLASGRDERSVLNCLFLLLTDAL